MRAAAGQFPSLQQPITAITPTRPGMSWLAWLLLTLGRWIATLKMVSELEFIHFAQWQRVRTKNLPRLTPDQPAEDFAYDFFVFTTNYNGDWDQYIDTFARVPHIRLGMRLLWGTSQGFPGPIPLRTFKQYIHYHSYPETLYYSAYPASTVRNIEAAVAVKAELQKFANVSSTTKAETPAAFRTRHLEMLKAIAPKLGSAPGVHPFTIETSEPGESIPVLGRLAGGGKTGQTLIAAMSPIEVKPGYEVTNEIAARIAAVSESTTPSPFAKCPMLHFARLVVLDDLIPKLGSSPAASLRTNYLLFVAAIDGELDDFLDCLHAADPKFVQDVWGRCLGYPEDGRGPVFLRRYIARSLLPVQLPYVAFPEHTALDIRGAVSIHADMLDWMAADRHSTSDAELMAEWQSWLDQLFDGTRAFR
jgi:hypothetical protein